MKYNKSFYDKVEIYPDGRDVDVRNKTQKLVKTRIVHWCSICETHMHKNTIMVCERAFVDGEPCSSYMCVDCIDKYVEKNSWALNLPEVQNDLSVSKL